MNLYPLKFTPISKYRLWGGNKLNTFLNKGFTGDNNGESWEISDVKGDETKVANGEFSGKTLKELSKQFKGKLLGNNVYETFGTEFPLLIKFIDAKTPLSIQVHPHDHIEKSVIILLERTKCGISWMLMIAQKLLWGLTIS